MNEISPPANNSIGEAMSKIGYGVTESEKSVILPSPESVAYFLVN